MAKFRVWAKSISYCYVDIEAEDENQAQEIADELDGGNYNPTPDGDWEMLEDVEVLSDDAHVDYKASEWYED